MVYGSDNIGIMELYKIRHNIAGMDVTISCRSSVNFAVHVYCKIPQRTARYHTAEFAVFCS